MDHIKIETCDNTIYKHMFEYNIIDDNNILIKRVDEKYGWWVDFSINIINTKNNTINTVIIGKNPSSYMKIHTVNFSLGYSNHPIPDDQKFEIKEDRNGIVFDSNIINEKDILLNDNDIVVIVSGIVYVSNKELTGNTSRSIFSSDERYNQTIQTLQSIITYIPNSKIILLEQSKFFPEDKLKNISKYCDYIIQYKNDEQNDYNSNIQGFNKGLGEMYVITHFLDIIKNKNFKTIFKTNGRYVITSDFDINNFINETTFKVIKGDGRMGIITYSVFYSISKDVLNLYIEHQKVWIKKNCRESVEHVLTMFVESIPNCNLITTIGIKGNLGISGAKCYL